jgi:16S rRNA (uracil1498-N3)-methyltransferase
LAERRRFVIDPAECGAVVTIDADETSHVRRSLRLKAGDLIEGADGRGWIYTLELCPGRGREAKVKVIRRERARGTRPLNVIVAVGLIKGPRMDWAVEKAAELGARAFVPFHSERSVPFGRGKGARWRRIAKAALKQSLGVYRMCVSEPRGFDYVLKLSRAVGSSLVADSAGPPIKLARADLPRRVSCLLVFGPEGALSADESSRLVETGAGLFSLGEERLRTETAVAAGLAALWQATS